jgi:tetratricopeptide (TPR) repeat protein
VAPLLLSIRTVPIIAFDLPSDLTTLAAASDRPVECGGWPGAPDSDGAWEVVRRSSSGPRCAVLARGYAQLHENPERALKLALQVEKGWSDSAAPIVLRARALVRLGRFDEAHRQFGRAVAIDAAALKSPPALRDRAIAASRTGHVAEARAVTRLLLPRVALLQNPAGSVRVHIEAAAMAMLDGEQGLDEAIAYLSSARHTVTAPELGEIVLSTLALALDRAGRREEGRALLESASGPWRLVALVDPEDPAARHFDLPFLPAGEVNALIAMLAERVDRDLARRHWERFLELRGNGAFVEHARMHLRGLGVR